MEYKKKGIITGALILTLASVITRILGFVYRIYMTKAIGAEGIGLYQLIMPLYSLAWSISCSGFTMTIARLVSQENAKREYGNMGRALKQSLVITCSIAIMISVFMYSFSGYIAEFLLHDARVTFSLKILSLALPFMAAGSCIRGYYFGLQESSVPAVSQVLEQCVRMVIIFSLAGIFIPLGLEYACAAAVIGILAGELISFLFVLYSYIIFKKKYRLNAKPSMASAEMFSVIMAMALPLTMNRIIGSLLSTVENLLIPQKLEMFGYTAKQAIILYGQITGMALPLIFFPSAILYALSTTLVPAISEAIAVNNKARIAYTINKSMLFTSVIGIGACAVFLVFSKELGLVIYDQDISDILFMLGVMCPLWYMSITFSGILNGLGQQVFMFRNSLISSAINIGFIFFLVPKYGLTAFIIGWFISLVVVIFIDASKIRECAEINFPVVQWFLKPVLSALGTGLAVKFLARTIIFPMFGSVAGLVIAIGVLGLSFSVFVVLLGVISAGDIKSLFKGLPIRKMQQVPSREKNILQ